MTKNITRKIPIYINKLDPVVDAARVWLLRNGFKIEKEKKYESREYYSTAINAQQVLKIEIKVGYWIYAILQGPEEAVTLLAASLPNEVRKQIQAQEKATAEEAEKEEKAWKKAWKNDIKKFIELHGAELIEFIKPYARVPIDTIEDNLYRDEEGEPQEIDELKEPKGFNRRFMIDVLQQLIDTGQIQGYVRPFGDTMCYIQLQPLGS